MSVPKHSEPSSTSGLCTECQTFYGSQANKGLCSSCYKYLPLDSERASSKRKQSHHPLSPKNRSRCPLFPKSQRRSRRKTCKRTASDVTHATRRQGCWVPNANVASSSVIRIDCPRRTAAPSISEEGGRRSQRKL